MTVECRICKGRVCIDTSFGILQNDNPPEKVPVDPAKIRIIRGKIAACEIKQTHDWFELEGKTDTLHLGS